jgi:hypothetical protein
MFPTLANVQNYYQDSAISYKEKHEVIYREFEHNVFIKEPKLQQAFQRTEGFGELAFQWNWFLAVQEVPREFKFLEIGVYKGRVLATIQYLADLFGKAVTIVGVTPLSGAGDKYSGYEEVDYFAAIEGAYAKTGVSFANTTLVKGFSEDPLSLMHATAKGPYDILFIDGCHDYEVVCQDISNYVPMLKPNGLLVMDDASLFLEAPAGRFHGHPDVAKAIRDVLDTRQDLQHVYAVGHNRVWRKMLGHSD